MKKEVRFLISVASILLISSLVLAGCMQVISESKYEPKDYDMDIVSQTVTEKGDGNIIENNPTPQNDMQKKFAEMSLISESGKSITVISEDYLNRYWEENKNNSVALTAAEVLYIIQDSIKIYFEYDECILIGNQELESKHPSLENRPYLLNGKLTLNTISENALGVNYIKACEEIQWIIIYRLAALSSGDAFISYYDLLNESDGIWSNEYTESALFYIPAHEKNTLSRKEWAEIILYNGAVPEHLPWIQYFNLSAYGSSVIEHFAIDRAHIRIFPTAEMESSQANRVVDIIDRTEVADDMCEPFWTDENFVYYFPCIQSQSVFARLYDGREILLVDALKLGYITPEEFENFDFLFWREVKRTENTEPDIPYFKATATYTDKKRTDGIYPYANFVKDTVALTQYYNDITANDVYVIDKGTHEVPSFIEMFQSYDGPWFESNSLILVVVEADSDILPKVSSITVDGSNVHVKLDPESLGKKQDQVYTIFIETNKLDNIESINVE